MKQKLSKRHVLLGSLLLPLIGCGGGGGGSDEAEFAGVWNGSASFVEDTCPTFLEEYSIFFAHLVNQNDSTIVLDNGASVFQGLATQSGFTATLTRAAREPMPFVGACDETIVWRYEQIERDLANFVVRTSTITCTDGDNTQTCTRTFTGSAYRQNSHPGFPIDVGSGGSPGFEGDSTSTENTISDTQI